MKLDSKVIIMIYRIINSYKALKDHETTAVYTDDYIISLNGIIESHIQLVIFDNFTLF